MKRLSPVLGAVLALALAVPSLAPAQVKTVDRLKFPSLPDMAIPSSTRVVLDNGMVVILIEDHELPLVDASMRIHTGARLEPAAKRGMASLTGSVLRTGGTKTMTGDQLDDFLEGKAASVETGIDSEAGTAGMNCLKADFPQVLKIFADVLRNPVFDNDKLEVARTQMVSGISRQNDDPQGILFREFGEIIYGEDSPYAANPSYESVGAVSREDLVAWHKKYFHPNRIILGLVGDFKTAEAVALVKQVFGDWKQGPAPEKVDVAYNKTVKPGMYYVEKNDMTQSNIIMGHLGTLRSNPDYYALEVMNEIFSGGFASRLFTNVRSKKGLAYAVRGGVYSDWDHPATFQMWMTTKTETTAAGIDALVEEAKNITAQPPTDDEVSRSKAAILNSFVFNSDSTRKILNQQLTYEYYGYPLDWLSRYRKGIEQVTITQAREVAAKYIHPEQFATLVVGPKEGQDRPLSSFGAVTAVDITIPEPEAPRVAVTAEGKKKGMALVSKILEGMGGAARVDAIEVMEQKASAVAVTPQGEMSVSISTLLEFPNRMRQELSLPFGTITTVLNGDDAFQVSPQGTRDLPDSQKDSATKGMRRIPIFLLKNRAAASFVAVGLGQKQQDGKAVEMLQIELEGDTVTLAVDPAKGQILSMAYQGQDFAGARGEVIQTLSDYRAVGGVMFSHKSVQIFNGAPMLTTTVESMKVNQPVAEGTFVRPEAMTAQGTDS